LIHALKTRDGSRQKNDPFKKFEDLREVGVEVDRRLNIPRSEFR
jgi:hypothetical protein